MYWQLPSIAGGRLLHLQLRMHHAMVTRDPHSMGFKQYKWGTYEQCIIMEYLINLYLVFVDFEKGFDSINRNKVWEVMIWNTMPHD
jgi:hypothetical protein